MRCTTKRKPPPPFVMFESEETTKRAIEKTLNMLCNNNGDIHEHIKILRSFTKFVKEYIIDYPDWDCFLVNCSTRILKYARTPNTSNIFRTDLCRIAAVINSSAVEILQNDPSKSEKLVVSITDCVGACLEHLKDEYKEENTDTISYVIFAMHSLFAIGKPSYPYVPGLLATRILCMPDAFLNIFKYISNPEFKHDSILIDYIVALFLGLIGSIYPNSEYTESHLEDIFRPTMNAMKTFIPTERITPHLLNHFCMLLSCVITQFGDIKNHPLNDSGLRTEMLEWFSYRVMECAFHKDRNVLEKTNFCVIFSFLIKGHYNELLEKEIVLQAFEVLVVHCYCAGEYIGPCFRHSVLSMSAMYNMFWICLATIGKSSVIPNLKYLAEVMLGCVEVMEAERAMPSDHNCTFSNINLASYLMYLSCKKIELFHEMTDTQLSNLVYFTTTEFDVTEQDRDESAIFLFVLFSNLSVCSEDIALEGIGYVFGKGAHERFKNGLRNYPEVCSDGFRESIL